MNSPADGANTSGLTPAGSIERSVTYLVIGVGLMLFFLLAVLGMGRVESLSTKATRDLTPDETAPPSEIVGTGEPQPQ